MQTYTDKIQRKTSFSTTETASRQSSGSVSDFPEDHRSSAVAQRKIQEMADKSPQVRQLAKVQNMANGFSGSDPVIQRVISDTKQPRSNLCWAAVGFAIHQHKGGTEPDIPTFVRNKGSASSPNKFNTNKINDIDQIIGSASNENFLIGSDTSGSYGKGGITNKLKNDKPIVANLDGQHYVILISSRTDKGAYKITYMDPATGTSQEAVTEQDPLEGSKITKLDGHKLTALYYTK